MMTESNLDHFVLTYNVTSVESPTLLVNNVNNVIKMSIDGTVLPSPVKSFTFSTEGEHVVEIWIRSHYVGINCFSGNANLVGIEFPTTPMTIEQMAFRYCSKLVLDIGKIPETTIIKGNAFSDCPLVYGVLRLQHGEIGCAWSNTSIQGMVNPGTYNGGVRFLSGNASLKFVDFDENTIAFGSQMFISSNNIESIVLRYNGIVTEGGAFSWGPNPDIYVPDDLVESYKVATGWSNRASKIKPISEYVEPVI